eukprot:1481288-Pyramimonas_sp.AAC.1
MEVADARKKLNNTKPSRSRHAALGHKLQRSNGKLEKLEEDITPQQALIEAAQVGLQSTQEKARVLRVKIVAANIELQSTMAQVAPS